MNLPLLNLLTAPSLEQSLPSPTVPAEGKTATPATDFAQWLHARADDAGIFAEHAQDSLPAMALTPTEEPATETDDTEELPWPPEGLASLWSPAPPPEPAPPLHSPATAAPPPAASSDSPRTATASLRVALTIQAPDTPEFPATASAQPAPPSPLSAPPDTLPTPEAPAQPASTPAIPASPVPPAAAPISEDLAPLAHLPEDLQGERASATVSLNDVPLNDAPLNVPPATPAIPAPPPSPLTQPQPTPPAITPPLPAPDIHADNFTQALGPHIQWLAGHKIDHAHLHLNPQELGPLEIHLQLDGDQLQAHFNSPHVEVRQTLEHALPQLRELLGEHGLHLSQSTVSQHSSQQQRPSPMPSAPGFVPDTADEDAPHPMPTAQPTTTRSLLDAYA